MTRQVDARTGRVLVALLVAAGLQGGAPVRAADDKEEPAGPVIRLPGHTGAVVCIAFSPDGRFAATHGGLGDHSFHLWDVGKRKRVYKLETPECEGAAVLWAGGKRLVSGGGGSGGGCVVLRDPGTGKPEGKPLGHDGLVRGVALARDGKRLASADSVGKVRVWDFKTGEKLSEFDHGKGVSGVAFSPDGRYLLTGCDDMTVRLWDTEKDRQERPLKGHTAAVGRVAFSADGRRLYSASFAPLGESDNTVRTWDAQTGKEVGKLEVGGEGRVLVSADFSPDGRRALTGHSNGEVCLWDLDAGKKVTAFTNHKHPVQSVAFSPDGRLALSGEDCQGGSEMWLYRLPRP